MLGKDEKAEPQKQQATAATTTEADLAVAEIPTIKFTETSFYAVRITNDTKFLKIPKYASVSDVHDGIFSVTSEYGDVAFFYEDGTMLFDYIWKAIGNFVPAQFDNGVCLMRSKEKVGTQYPLCILYRDGRVKQLPTEYYNGTQFLDGIARLQKKTPRGNVWVYINAAGKEIYPNLTEESRRSVYRCISYVICIVTGISLFLYLIIRFTDLEHSSNQMVAYSLGNVFQGRLFGILNNPNTLGPIAVVAVIITLYRRLVWKEVVAIWFLCCSVLVNLLCLYLSDSRAALVAGVACAGLALLSLLPVKARRICLIALVICLLLVLANLGSILTMLTDMTGRDWVTGSARTPMWEYSPTLIKQHPVFGFGTRAAYRAVSGDIIHPNGTHNLYIETTLLYGLVASIPLVLTVLGIAMSAIRRFVSDGGQVRYVPELGLLIFLFFFVESFFETLLYQSAPFQILLFISMYECSRSYLPRFGVIGVQKDEK